MYEFNLDKGNVELKFKVSEEPVEGKILIKYSINGNEEKIADKFEKNRIYFNGHHILNGQKLRGVDLTPYADIKHQITRIKNSVDQYVISEKNKIVDEILCSKRPINCCIVGCDYPKYQSTIKLTKEEKNILGDCWYNLIEQAVKNYHKKLNAESMPTYAHDYLDRCICGITTEDKLPIGAFDAKHEQRVLDYHDFKPEIVTSFSINLKDLIEKRIIAKVKQESKEVEELAEKFALAKRTGEKVLIKSYSEECDDPNEDCDVDNVSVYAMPNGEHKIVRNHTW